MALIPDYEPRQEAIPSAKETELTHAPVEVDWRAEIRRRKPMGKHSTRRRAAGWMGVGTILLAMGIIGTDSGQSAFANGCPMCSGSIGLSFFLWGVVLLTNGSAEGGAG